MCHKTHDQTAELGIVSGKTSETRITRRGRSIGISDHPSLANEVYTIIRWILDSRTSMVVLLHHTSRLIMSCLQRL
jgi:hypothetical protein